MLTYLTGRLATPALALARHYMQVTLPPDLRAVAAYYGWAHDLDTGPDAGRPAPRLRADLDPRLAQLLGLDPVTLLDLETIANLLAGHRADGRPIPGKRVQAGERLTFIDLCWSADKSVSIAWALARTPAEAAVIALAIREAVHETMVRMVAPLIGRARRGKAGSAGSETGSIAWIAFDHWTSRPTPGAAGDAQLHVHCPVLNVVRTTDGHVGGLDLQRLNGRVHELGAIFQANLARNLRRAGIAVALDPTLGCARITAIPDAVRSAFAKRTVIGTAAAYAQAGELGLDWDDLEERSRIALLKQGVQGDPRAAKRDDLGDRASWQAEAASLGYRHLGVLGTEPVQPMPTREQRLERAYAVALDLLEPKLENVAVLPESQVRLAAARSLIAAGIEEVGDVEGVLELIHTRGVRQEGRIVTLLPGAPGPDADATGWQRGARSYTTGLHIEREGELIDLVREAAAERRGALSAKAITAAISRLGRDFSGTAHGRTQREAMDRLGTGAAFTAVIGVAGSGKTTLLQPLVDAYTAAGATVFGTSLGWKQTRALTETGIPAERCLALAKLLEDCERGKIVLGPDTVVVVDELGQVGTRDLLRLMRLRTTNGRFRILAVGDPRQCSSVAAGPVIELLREALGSEAIPEILTTVRQREQDERETTGMFRQGRAAEALMRKRRDGTARLVPGSPAAVAELVANLWTERHAEHADDPTYSLSVSAPTNADALMLAGAIRARRRKAGELVGPDHLVQATDNVGRKFEVTLAVGDRVRLFARTPARSSSGQTLEIGVNGSVLEIETIGPEGVRLRDAGGRSGSVAWTTLLHPDGDPAEPRYRLGYGDVLTIDSIQGVTSEESIFVMPNGSAPVDAFRGYTAASRHRARSYLICGETAERVAIAGRRPIGARRPVTDDEIWDRVAANLSREPTVVTATALVSRAREVAADARRTLPLALAPLEACAQRGLTRVSLRRGFARGWEVAALTDWAETIAEPIARQITDTAALADALPHRQEGAVSRKATDGPELGGFVRGRILRRLEIWAEGIGELLERQCAEIMGLTAGLSDPDRDVMVKPGRLARQFARWREIERLDGWGRSLTDWLDLQVRTTRAILTAISAKSLSKGSGSAAEQAPRPIEVGETRHQRKQARRRRGTKVDSGLEI
ncbi:MobF family relaxase [Methylobacterium sp. J-067]|uniref:MobF family relaxase n=1 Tax=Methylobacterium sp. J-067 TaxID=2836648 RepID=UPI001FB8BF48|nr:MobF family relaxase [Methylobacterium sp. J-067]MCJ2024467.1 relaxase domain-containing protein [Methylobacterium sp. J-067]